MSGELHRYREMLQPLSELDPGGARELAAEDHSSWDNAVRTLRGYHGDHLELEEAVAAFARALWSAPGWVEPPARIAEALLARSRHWPEAARAEAVALAGRFADRAYQLDSSSPPARAALARVQLARGEVHEADRTALTLLGASPDTLAVRAEIAEVKGDCNEALRLREAQVKAETEPGPARDARNKLGILLQTSGRLEDAVRSHRENLCRHPDYAWGHVNLASALEAMGQPLEAFAAVEDAVKLGLSEAQPFLDELTAALDRRALDDFRARLRHGRDGDVIDFCDFLSKSEAAA